jgi:methyl acetate hydrolase
MGADGFRRRDVLASAAAVSAATMLGFGPAARAADDPHAAIDQALRRAVDTKEVPGVVAMAASDKGILYQGAFGTRSAAGGAPMTIDTVFRIASMTKAVTSVAAMQLVEQGKLKLEDPVPAIDPALASPQVLDGFDAAGAPIVRPAKGPITLRHLLTHTAGFTYEVWDANTTRYVKASGVPSMSTGKLAALRMPLEFDPGARWEYGINLDWVGRIVEAVSSQPIDVYFREHILGPLGMKDTGFMTSDEQRSRQAVVHQRQPDGSLTPQPLETRQTPEFFSGGGALYSTAPDYLTFVQMLLHGGTCNGAQILRPETVALMSKNQIGDLQAGILKTQQPGRSNDVDFFPGQQVRWGLGYMINMEPVKRVGGVIMTQILPFADVQTVKLYGQFESGVYNALKAT